METSGRAGALKEPIACIVLKYGGHELATGTLRRVSPKEVVEAVGPELSLPGRLGCYPCRCELPELYRWEQAVANFPSF